VLRSTRKLMFAELLFWVKSGEVWGSKVLLMISVSYWVDAYKHDYLFLG
jgi:hypothetical protein